MRRLCIYLTYDPHDIADSYIAYMLKELKTTVSYLVVVSHSGYVSKEHDKICPFADRIIYRKNKGYDAGGFKDALCNYIGWDKVYEYEELVLANDSFYGPFRSMKSIFDDMSRQTCDFWGLTKHAYKETDDEIIREHIQSYFMVIRSRMLYSEEFRQYWENMPYYNHFNELVARHEMIFTAYFNNLGYVHGCLADMSPNDSTVNVRNNYMQYGYLQYELIVRRNFPFLKKKPILFDTLDLQTQENLKLALDYIEQNTEYDTDMIWENLIRTSNLADLQRKCHLSYIIPCHGEDSYDTGSNAAAVVFAEHAEAVEDVLGYLDKLKGSLTIKIYAKDQDIAGCYHKSGYCCAVLVEADALEAVKKELAEYRYLCIMHDCDISSDQKPSCNGKSYFYLSWHNLLAGKAYAGRILSCFEKDKRLGLLMPPAPNFADYFCMISNEWDDYYEEIKDCVNKNHISCQIAKEKRPLAPANNIWIRSEIVQKMPKEIFEKRFLPYIWACVAQSMGYYAGIAESDDYASLHMVNQQYYLDRIVSQVKRQYGKVDTFLNLQKQILKGALSEFCFTHRKIYVYGTGRKSLEYQDMIPDIEAYIVSDGQPLAERKDGKKTLYLSQLQSKEETGIVVCLSEENQEQVIPLLLAGKFQFLCI